ncbi:MAG: hypothetical protein ACRDHN_01920, partial [Thermomicrobiales bacterium]
LFAISIIMAMEQDFAKADRNKDTELDAVELSDFVRTSVPKLFRLNIQQVMPLETQTPTVAVPMLEQRTPATIAQKKSSAASK